MDSLEVLFGAMTPEQLTALKTALASVSDVSGRSPVRPRQLHDLRLLPTATDPRPTFFWSAETPRDFVPGPSRPYPKLMWHRETDEEITVQSATEEAAKADLYTTDPPRVEFAASPMDIVRDALDALTEEERRFVLDAQKKERMDALTAKLALLPPEQIEALLSGAAVPVKRGPGRPRKVTH